MTVSYLTVLVNTVYDTVIILIDTDN